MAGIPNQKYGPVPRKIVIDQLGSYPAARR
jgi:hypothetical protein